jgi:hypothetical protein
MRNAERKEKTGSEASDPESLPPKGKVEKSVKIRVNPHALCNAQPISPGCPKLLIDYRRKMQQA